MVAHTGSTTSLPCQINKDTPHGVVSFFLSEKQHIENFFVCVIPHSKAGHIRRLFSTLNLSGDIVGHWLSKQEGGFGVVSNSHCQSQVYNISVVWCCWQKWRFGGNGKGVFLPTWYCRISSDSVFWRIFLAAVGCPVYGFSSDCHVLLSIHCKKRLLIFPSQAGMSLYSPPIVYRHLGWGVENRLPFLQCIVRLFATGSKVSVAGCDNCWLSRVGIGGLWLVHCLSVVGCWWSVSYCCPFFPLSLPSSSIVIVCRCDHNLW